MSGVKARAVTDVVGQYTILYPGVLESIQDKINIAEIINLRTPNVSISKAIAAAISQARPRVGDSSQLPLPVVIQLDKPLDFTASDLVLICKNKASPLDQSIFTGVVFKVSKPSKSDVTIAIHRIDASVTLEQVMAEFNSSDIYLDEKQWTDRLPAVGGKPWNEEPFTFTIHKTRCALVTTYKSHPDQLVVVFGPSPPSAGSAGGSKRKRVISRKLKSLNKKRKYTQRLTRRRRYSYKRGRKN
jgi:hypothetical protein